MVIPAMLTNEEIVGLRNSTKAIYVYGEITYRDAFRHGRHTNYRYRHNGLTGVVGINSDLTGSDEGNSSKLKGQTLPSGVMEAFVGLEEGHPPHSLIRDARRPRPDREDRHRPGAMTASPNRLICSSRRRIPGRQRG